MSYVKLFGSILDSTIWQTAPHVKVTWITLLAMKDRDGEVESSIPFLAKRAGVTIEQATESLAIFLAPDPWSRTSDHEGRRIEETDHGWRILNHEKYRDKESEAERREKGAERQRRYRARRDGMVISPVYGADKAETARRAEERAGQICTYLIVQTGTGYMKIGQSTTPQQRMADLQVGSPVPLVMLRVIAGDHEAELHAALADARANGEWFRHTPTTEKRALALMDSVTVTPVTRYVTHVTPSDTDTDHPERASVPDPPISQPPDRGGGRDLDSGPAIAAPPAPRPSHPQPVDRADIRGRGHAVPPPPTDAAAALRRSLVDSFVRRVNEARKRLCAELRLGDARPIALMDGVGEPALIERLKESADPAADLDHVLRVSEAEARQKRELRWLGWSLAEPKAWRIRLAATLRETNGTTAPPPRPRPEPAPAPVELSAEERAEIAALTEKLKRGDYTTTEPKP